MLLPVLSPFLLKAIAALMAMLLLFSPTKFTPQKAFDQLDQNLIRQQIERVVRIRIENEIPDHYSPERRRESVEKIIATTTDHAMYEIEFGILKKRPNWEDREDWAAISEAFRTNILYEIDSDDFDDEDEEEEEGP